LSAVRKLIGDAQRNGIIDAEEAASLARVPNLRDKGTRLGNWLTREQAKELLQVPDRSKIKGSGTTSSSPFWSVGPCGPGSGQRYIQTTSSRGNAGPSSPICAARAAECAPWRFRSGVKQAIAAWMVAAEIEIGRRLRPLSKSGKLIGDELGDWAIWSVVEQSAKEIGIEHFGAHDLRRTCAKLCRKNGGALEQIKFLLGHSSIQTTERYLGSEQDIAVAVNDNLGI
jgi:hypothetical protein